MHKKQNMVLKALRHLLTGIIIGLIILVIAAFVVSLKYGDTIAHYVFDQIQMNYLKTPVKTDEIHFSFFKQFPNATIEFKNVLVKTPADFNFEDKHIRTDTLFFVQHLYLQMNFFDLLKKKFVVKNIHLDAGKICLLTNEKEEVNYIFWKTADSSSSPADTAGGKNKFQINLQKVSLSNMEIIFENKAKKLFVSGFVHDVGLKGAFAAENYSLHISSKIDFHIFKIDKITYLKNSALNLNSDLEVVKNNFMLKKGDVTFNKMEFDVAGNFTTDRNPDINLNADGKNIDIASILKMLPDQYGKVLENYSPEGKLYFNARIKGKVTKSSLPHMDVAFGIKNASVHKNKSGISISDIKLEGSFTNGNKNSAESSVLDLKNFDCTLGKSKISGSGTLKDFRNIYFTSVINTNLWLPEIHKFFGPDTLEYAEGTVIANAEVKGSIPGNENISLKDITKWNLKGDITFDHVSFKLKKSPVEVKNLSGKVEFDKDINLSQLSFNLADNDFNITCKLGNGINYFLKDSGTLFVEGDLNSKNINYETLGVYSAAKLPTVRLKAWHLFSPRGLT